MIMLLLPVIPCMILVIVAAHIAMRCQKRQHYIWQAHDKWTGEKVDNQ